MSLLDNLIPKISAVVELTACQVAIEVCVVPTQAGDLREAVERGLGVAAPKGSPSAIEEQGRAYVAAGKKCDTVASDLDAVATKQLPAAWKGAVAKTASEAVAAASLEVMTTTTVLGQAGQALTSWATDLDQAQRADLSGRASLGAAKKTIGDGFFVGFEMLIHPDDFYAARKDALDGIGQMLSAAKKVKSSGERTARLLNKLAKEARAEQVRGKGLDPLDTLVSAAEKNPGGPAGGGLTPTQLDRGSQLLDGMSEADRRQFDDLLKQAKSPEEAAYLWKTMAAGHSMAEIKKFSTLIHPYGSDPTWLSDHLSPAFSTPDSAKESSDHRDLTYQGKDVKVDGYTLYSQGNIGDCAAASTVVAQAGLDPMFMLHLTTGDQPGVAGSDSPEAFQSRLQDEYTSQYVQGQKADGQSQTYPALDTGLYPKGSEFLANNDLGHATGTSYHYVALDNSGATHNVLPQIESAVDSGKPVPFDVEGNVDGQNVGHQMVIIGHDGDKLQVYNPWGFTSWVTESQFVNNQIGGLTDGDDLRTVYGVALPS